MVDKSVNKVLITLVKALFINVSRETFSNFYDVWLEFIFISLFVFRAAVIVIFIRQPV
ncbi:hypothetical protein JCM15548_13656 [Geofilum rubicundum JCM 15548]|uniref:Uncharacterized protein n=1 Tax=Geofilum rubicundum JCM 15548 TaxID=1236989 RepID=A0A0E9M0F3_9BACT|nr:hypothetical protein JCM15548_13656 [Geofilum rubicundum JCM 15548]